MRRTELREHIFRLLFGIEFYSPDELQEQTGLYLGQLEEIGDQDRNYICGKLKAVSEKTKEIDEQINEHAKGWKTSRMNKVDLTILRLAVYEMKWDDDVPVSVAISEAVLLAKKYGGEDSSAFVNGVLAKIAG